MLAIGKLICFQGWGKVFASAYLISQLFLMLAEWMLTARFFVYAPPPEPAEADANEPTPPASNWHLLKVLRPYFWPAGCLHPSLCCITKTIPLQLKRNDDKA